MVLVSAGLLSNAVGTYEGFFFFTILLLKIKFRLLDKQVLNWMLLALRINLVSQRIIIIIIIIMIMIIIMI
jgi:hypothetical protein